MAEIASIERELVRLRGTVDQMLARGVAEAGTLAAQWEDLQRAIRDGANLIHSLTESEALYRTLVETSPEAIVITDLNRVVVTVNRQAVALFGAPSAEALVGRSIMGRVLPMRPLPANDFWQRLLTAGVVRDWECVLTRFDGSQFTADLSISLSPDTGGGARLLVGIVRDITPRRQSEAAARQALKMEALGRFAGGVAHEFNNVLTIIRGYAELLLKKAPDGDAGARKIRQIVKAADRATGLVTHLLTFSRQHTVEPEAIDVNAALADLEDSLRAVAGAAVELKFELDPAAGQVLIDPSQFNQMLMNLVANSRDAMPGSGTVAIRTRLMPPHVVISVADTGVGMTETVRSRIFEPFFTTKEVGQGVGLGLSAVYGSVAQAGGRISVDATPGQGATVSIHLPSYMGPESRP